MAAECRTCEFHGVFCGARDMEHVVEIFEAKGYHIDREKYDEDLTDHIRIIGPEYSIVWNAFSVAKDYPYYRFSVFDTRGEQIATESSRLEDEDWFLELLMTFLTWELAEVDG